MEKITINNRCRIVGQINLEAVKFYYSSEENEEIVEFKFSLGNNVIYLRFYTYIISFRFREMHSSFNEYVLDSTKVNLEDCLFLVEDSLYIKALNETSDGTVDFMYSGSGEIKHYVVVDRCEDSFYDIITNAEPEIIIEELEK